MEKDGGKRKLRKFTRREKAGISRSRSSNYICLNNFCIILELDMLWGKKQKEKIV